MNKWTDTQLRDAMRAAICELRFLCRENGMSESEKDRLLRQLARRWTDQGGIHETTDVEGLDELLFDRGRIVELQWAVIQGQLPECDNQAVFYAYRVVAACNSIAELSVADEPDE
jgi:hypothetical protein